jgi:hypothetical protein
MYNRSLLNLGHVRHLWEKISTGGANQTGSFSYIGLSPTKKWTEKVQNQQALVHDSTNDRETCRFCNSNASLFDIETNEQITMEEIGQKLSAPVHKNVL